MDAQTARDFLHRHHRAVLSTWHPDGSPQMSPVLLAVDETNHVVLSTRETATKTRNVRRDSRVTLCAFTDAFFGEWIQLDGRAHVLSLPEAMEPLVSYYQVINGEHENWEAYRQAMREQQRVLIRMEITRAGPNRHG